MKTTIYYSTKTRGLCDETGDPVCNIPALSFGEQPVWEIVVLDGDGEAAPLSDITAFRAAVDADLASSTDVMCRTLDGSITRTDNRIAVPLDADTERFLAVVDGRESVQAWFELMGFNASGGREFYLVFRIEAKMVVDPGTTDDLPETPQSELWAEKTWVSAVVEARPVSSAIIPIVSSGGYTTSAAVSAMIASGGTGGGGSADLTSYALKTDVLPIVSSGGYINSSGVQSMINSQLASVMTYKGAVADSASLPAADQTAGDTWHVNDTGAEYTWNGSAWEELGNAVNLEGYVQSSAILPIVSSGGFATSDTVSSMIASAGTGGGGSADLTSYALKTDVLPIVSSGGYVVSSGVAGVIASGGSSGQTLLNNGSGGVMWGNMTSGGGASAVVVSALTSGYIFVGSAVPIAVQTASGTFSPVSAGTLIVSSGNILIDPAPYLIAENSSAFAGNWTVYTMALPEIVVSSKSNGVGIHVVWSVSSGASSHGGTSASSITLYDGGVMAICIGGSAINTTVNSGGLMSVSSGGTADGVTVGSGGTMSVLSGGTATGVTSLTGAVVSSAAGATITYA